MGRPQRYETDALLDAAIALVAEGGPGALTMAAVARSAGAPSGSLYHRFASRDDLAAAVWLRTVERFQEGFLTAAGGPDPIGSAVQAAQHTTSWSRRHESEARVLLHGAQDLGRAGWPAGAADRAATLDARSRRALAGLARALGLPGKGGVERVTFAVVDVPLALVRRHLTAGRPVPASAEDLVEVAVRALVASDPDVPRRPWSEISRMRDDAA